MKLQVRNPDRVIFIPSDQNGENLVSSRDLLIKAVDQSLGSTEGLSFSYQFQPSFVDVLLSWPQVHPIDLSLSAL